jgi:cellulose synthase/poly-beta-1,6-N-acetylglucosamine synthase-like glycosyltransferase
MFELAIILLVFLYVIQVIIYLIASNKKFPRLADEELPTASVIVAVRDEEIVIERCLKALENLQYPDGKLEIIIVNDNSTDKTGEILQKFSIGKNRFKIIDSTEQTGHLRGKSNALVQGLKIASGEIILTTDADCKVNPLWAKTMASYFTEKIGLLGGMTTQETGSVWKGMQHLDFIYLLAAGSGTINAGLPLSVIGNNMAYKRTAYNETGGYESMPISVTEDSQLLAAIVKLKKYKIIYPIDEGTLIESIPMPDIKSLFKQKKRWGIGGLKVPSHGLVILGTAFFSHVGIAVITIINPLLGFYLFLAEILIDFVFFFSVLYRLRILSTIKYFLFFQIYYFTYIIVLPFILLFSTSVEWKGRKF